MLIALQLYKLLHLLGLAMLMGGVLTSFLITRRCKGDAGADQGAFVASHLVAAPGLLLLIVTGFAQSFLHQWSEFTGAGYMHAKLTLVALSAIFLAMDIRAQGNARRARKKEGDNTLAIGQSVATRTLAGGLNLVTLLLIVALIVFRPF